MSIDDALQAVRQRNPGQTEFHQAVGEVLTSLRPVIEAHPAYLDHNVLERLVEPDRHHVFRVTWEDDEGRVHVNRGQRVQFNNALGPYKGGIRFHPGVTISTIRFLGFEQVFKNALTGLNLGGGKGGADFDPGGRSDREIMRFCQAFMTGLVEHLGDVTDVPAGDIGVGTREIGYLFGHYRALRKRHEGALTGKGLEWGGSRLRAEASGYGVVYFARLMLEAMDTDLRDKRCAVSGSGNVAIHTIERLQQFGAIPLTVTDSGGTVHDPHGIDLDLLKRVKLHERGRLTGYAERRDDATHTPREEYPDGRNPVWDTDCDLAIPCATENELNADDAERLIDNGCRMVVEGANMPCTGGAIERFREAGVAVGPAKAANAGGVVVSQFEMQQNATMHRWSRDTVDRALGTTMEHIHRATRDAAERYDRAGDLVAGANIAGFVRVADAMCAQGIT